MGIKYLVIFINEEDIVSTFNDVFKCLLSIFDNSSFC